MTVRSILTRLGRTGDMPRGPWVVGGKIVQMSADASPWDLSIREAHAAGK